jgi:hypothetical protein
MSRRLQAETAQTAIKSNYDQHLTLVTQADQKAGMLITVAALVLSITFSLLVPRLADDTRLILPVGVLAVSCLVVLTLAVLAAFPRRAHRKHQTPLQVNPMFHGGFTHLSLTEYQQAVGAMLIDPSRAFDDMARDIYYLGRVVDRKYRYVRAAFTMFVAGMILTAVSFALAYTIPGLDSKREVAHRSEALAFCPGVQPHEVGSVGDVRLKELSGLAASPDQPDVFWSHADQGNDAVVSAINSRGDILARYQLAGIKNEDWEDIAVGSGPGGGNYVYVGDIGDNDAKRTDVSVLRFPEPRAPSSPDSSQHQVTPERIPLIYPGSAAHDAETLMIDPVENKIIVVTKAKDGRNQLYEGPLLPENGQIRLQRGGTVLLTGADDKDADAHLAAATGGAISQDGRTIVIRSNHRAAVWQRQGNQPVATTVLSTPCIVDLTREGQGEAIALSTDGRQAFTSGESDTPIIQEWQPHP